MYVGYFLEIEQHLAAAKFGVYLIQDGCSEELEEVLESLEKAKIALRDLTLELEASK